MDGSAHFAANRRGRGVTRVHLALFAYQCLVRLMLLAGIAGLAGCGDTRSETAVSESTASPTAEGESTGPTTGRATEKNGSADSTAPVASASTGTDAEAVSGDLQRVRTALSDLAAAHRNLDPEAWQDAFDRLQSVDAEGVPALLEALSDSEIIVREQASALLTQFVDRVRQTELLRTALSDDSALVRVNIASALSVAQEYPEEAVAVLQELLENENSSIRQQAAIALGNYGEDAAPAVPPLTELLAGVEPDVREAAAIALGRIGAPARSALPDLEAVAAESGDSLRDAARSAIKAIENASPAADDM